MWSSLEKYLAHGGLKSVAFFFFFFFFFFFVLVGMEISMGRL